MEYFNALLIPAVIGSEVASDFLMHRISRRVQS